ncbi:MAG TPA: HslU--HslV peptidase ATPase subunit [Clostridiales bacterium UBA8153]|nr:HslU--HslV peptidase ATPase subunit [Clostridiales bacterium UBA8153]
MQELTPRQIVAELDRYIVGQAAAKRAVAVAVRNRLRRQRIPADFQEEVVPKNILMIGPTGVGKTEIARRLARLVNAPFIKVEATKFTEVGYVGRDVDSIVRDLVEASVRLVKSEYAERVRESAQVRADERLLELLAPTPRRRSGVASPFKALLGAEDDPEPAEERGDYEEEVRSARFRRRQTREALASGALEEEMVEIELEDTTNPMAGLFEGAGLYEMGVNLPELFGGMLPKRKKKRRVTVREARRLLANEEAQQLVDTDAAAGEAIHRAEQLGIVFIDELDKVAGREGMVGPDVSREGVQRDILPIVEGSTVNTKYGPVRTDHMLFIAAGAFHMSKPSDLIPELQGRFPVRVELDPLTAGDFVRILSEPENSLVKQYQALLATEGIELVFTREAIAEIADIAYRVNEQGESIGARRLHTVMEKLLEELAFSASELGDKKVIMDRAQVTEKLAEIAGNRDLAKYVL